MCPGAVVSMGVASVCYGWLRGGHKLPLQPETFHVEHVLGEGQEWSTWKVQTSAPLPGTVKCSSAGTGGSCREVIHTTRVVWDASGRNAANNSRVAATA